MLAIEVKFLGPTNNKGSRYKAFAYGRESATISADYSLDSHENARLAAEALLLKNGIESKITGFGWLPNGNAAFTFTKI